MSVQATDLVTGAFGYTGSRIAQRLLASGRAVRTMTRRVDITHELAGRVERFATASPAGTTPTRFSDWLAANGNHVGRHWSSELARNFAKLQVDER